LLWASEFPLLFRFFSASFPYRKRMKRIAAFTLTSWSAAGLLYVGQHSVALIAISGVVALAGFDLLRP
jgi:hypothetical protein